MADLSKFNAKELATFDRELQEFRSSYSKLTLDARATFRIWLQRLCSVVEDQPEHIDLSVLCRVNQLDTDEDGDIIYDGVVHLGPKPMLAAVKAWDSGAEFTPDSFVQIN